MQRVNKYYHMCEKGHLTVSDSVTKKKCDMEIQEIKLVKSGRGGVDKEILGKHPCDAEIKQTKEIPEELILSRVWDFHELKAFMQDQPSDNLRVHFILALQKAFVYLNKEIRAANEGFNELIRMSK